MMAVQRRSLVVVAGLPGAGKSTLLRDVGPSVTVVDSDQIREWLASRLPSGTPYSRYRPLVHIVHRIRIALAAIFAPGPVAVHDPATGVGTRLTLVIIGTLTWRVLHFIWVETTPEEALAGQRARGRVLRKASFARHVGRSRRLDLSRPPRGWRSITVVGRRTRLCLRSERVGP
ncbi:Zeta toxin [Kibdelosporangium philippinense]|uniref:Zeta toxin n=1 Tax=Kibdelosporangium philippinense TaxID=211113 RepID=A0ABS8ZDI3_9PSEU|nr:AAA family ATPase [Kibdelosporangium philippinense]MCE7005894.1 Zeta toxin [Kibdelosporangium philippinense]